MKKINELTIYEIVCRKFTIFYRQNLASLFQVQEKFKPCRNSKLNISSTCLFKWQSCKNCMATSSSFH